MHLRAYVFYLHMDVQLAMCLVVLNWQSWFLFKYDLILDMKCVILIIIVIFISSIFYLKKS